MNNFIVTSSSYPLTSISAYTVLQSFSGISTPFVPTPHQLPASLRKFIHTSTQQPEFESSITFISAQKTTTEGPTVLKPAPLPDDYDAQVEEFMHFLDSFDSESEMTDDETAER